MGQQGNSGCNNQYNDQKVFELLQKNLDDALSLSFRQLIVAVGFQSAFRFFRLGCCLAALLPVRLLCDTMLPLDTLLICIKIPVKPGKGNNKKDF